MRTTGDVEPQKFISLLQKKTWQKKVIQDLKFKYRTSKICKAKESLGFEGEQMAEAWALCRPLGDCFSPESAAGSSSWNKSGDWGKQALGSQGMLVLNNGKSFPRASPLNLSPTQTRITTARGTQDQTCLFRGECEGFVTRQNTEWPGTEGEMN